MADFINFEAEADFCQDADVGDEVSDFSAVASENSFIDDQDVSTDANFYRHFENVGNDIEQVLKDAYNEGLEDIENFDEVSNLCEGSEKEFEIDNYKDFEVDTPKFNETLFPRVDTEDQKVHNQFSCAILYALRFDKTGFKDQCDKKDFEKSIDKSLEVLIKVLLKNLSTNSNLLWIYKNFRIYVMKLILFYQNTVIF